MHRLTLQGSATVVCWSSPTAVWPTLLSWPGPCSTWSSPSALSSPGPPATTTGIQVRQTPQQYSWLLHQSTLWWLRKKNSVSEFCFSRQNDTRDWSNKTNTTSAATEFWEYVDEPIWHHFKLFQGLDLLSFSFSCQTKSVGYLRRHWGDRECAMGSSFVSNGHVGHLLLLYLERGRDNWKGTWKIFKMKICTFRTLNCVNVSRWCISLQSFPMWCCLFFWSVDLLFLGLWKECCIIFCLKFHNSLTLR